MGNPISGKKKLEEERNDLLEYVSDSDKMFVDSEESATSGSKRSDTVKHQKHYWEMMDGKTEDEQESTGNRVSCTRPLTLDKLGHDCLETQSKGDSDCLETQSKGDSDMTPSDQRSHEENISSFKESDYWSEDSSGSGSSKEKETSFESETDGLPHNTGLFTLFAPLSIEYDFNRSSTAQWVDQANMSLEVQMLYEIPEKNSEQVLKADKQRLSCLRQSSLVQIQLKELVVPLTENNISTSVLDKNTEVSQERTSRDTDCSIPTVSKFTSSRSNNSIDHPICNDIGLGHDSAEKAFSVHHQTQKHRDIRDMDLDSNTSSEEALNDNRKIQIELISSDTGLESDTNTENTLSHTSKTRLVSSDTGLKSDISVENGLNHSRQTWKHRVSSDMVLESDISEEKDLSHNSQALKYQVSSDTGLESDVNGKQGLSHSRQTWKHLISSDTDLEIDISAEKVLRHSRQSQKHQVSSDSHQTGKHLDTCHSMEVLPALSVKLGVEENQAKINAAMKEPDYCVFDMVWQEWPGCVLSSSSDDGHGYHQSDKDTTGTSSGNPTDTFKERLQQMASNSIFNMADCGSDVIESSLSHPVLQIATMPLSTLPPGGADVNTVPTGDTSATIPPNSSDMTTQRLPPGGSATAGPNIQVCMEVCESQSQTDMQDLIDSLFTMDDFSFMD